MFHRHNYDIIDKHVVRSIQDLHKEATGVALIPEDCLGASHIYKHKIIYILKCKVCKKIKKMVEYVDYS
jgi:hypothetical protein